MAIHMAVRRILRISSSGSARFPEGAAKSWPEARTSDMRGILPCLTAACVLFGATLATRAPALAAKTVPATPSAIAVYAKVLHHINPQMPSWQSHDLAKRVLVSAERWRLDATMLVAIVTVESRWHTHAVSRAGAIGLGQLMPGTAANLGVNPHDPAQNLSGAARYLRGLISRFGTDHYSLVFAAYNAGPEGGHPIWRDSAFRRNAELRGTRARHVAVPRKDDPSATAGACRAAGPWPRYRLLVRVERRVGEL